MQLLPRDGMGLGTHAEEAAESGDCMNDVAANLLDHEALNRPDLLSVHIVNSGTLDVVALDQRVSRTG